MTSIGETLRRERMRRGLDVEAVSNELKISQRFVKAIEDDQFERLPAGVFAKSFVRQYARYLGLNEDEMATEVQKIMDPPPIPSDIPDNRQPPASLIQVPRMSEWESVGDGRSFSSWLPAAALVVVVMLLCSGVYALWQRARRLPSPGEEAVVTQPAQSAQSPVEANPPAAQPPAQTSPQGQEPAQTPTQQAPPASSPQTAPPQSAPPQGEARPAAQSSADRPADGAASASRPPAAASDGSPMVQVGKPGGPVRVELTASELVWIAARSDGQMSFTGTLEANQTRTIEAKDSISLRLGNAGGVNIVLNGKPIGAVGPRGQVRMVQLTSGGFQIVAAPAPAAPKPPVPLDPLDRF